MSTTHRSESTGLVVTAFYGGAARGAMVELCGLPLFGWGERQVVDLSIEQARELLRLLQLATAKEHG